MNESKQKYLIGIPPVEVPSCGDKCHFSQSWPREVDYVFIVMDTRWQCPWLGVRVCLSYMGEQEEVMKVRKKTTVTSYKQVHELLIPWTLTTQTFFSWLQWFSFCFSQELASSLVIFVSSSLCCWLLGTVGLIISRLPACFNGEGCLSVWAERLAYPLVLKSFVRKQE